MKDCCQVSRVRVDDTSRPDVVVEVCTVCGARHIRFRVDPGVVGVKLKP